MTDVEKKVDMSLTNSPRARQKEAKKGEEARKKTVRGAAKTASKKES